MFNKLRKRVELVKEIGYAQKRINTGFVPMERKELGGIEYFQCDLQVKSMGAAIAVAGEHPEIGRIIVCDDKFEALPEDVRLFILKHEEGHVVNGDLDKEDKELKKEFRKRNKRNYVPEMELKADEYAVKQTSLATGLYALQLTMDIMEEMGLSSQELIIRRRHLIDLYK